MSKEIFDHDICRDCGGACCKNASCMAHPSDFGDTPEEIKTNVLMALRDGIFIVDYWDGDCPGIPTDLVGYFVRPRHVGDRDLIVLGSWYGPCILLQEDGCPFDDESRPMGGRTLEPKVDASCVQHIGDGKTHEKIFFAKEWLPYNDIFESLYGENI